MTWTKLSDDFDDDCADLSDAAFRTHVQGLQHSCRRMTDGVITHRWLRRFSDTDDPEAAAAELVARGFWQARDGDWLVVHHLEHQPTRADVEKKRQDQVTRQRLSRENKQKRNGQGKVTQDVTRDKDRDRLRDPGRDGAGQDGAAKEGLRDGAEDSQHGRTPANPGARPLRAVAIPDEPEPVCAVPSCDQLARRACLTCATPTTCGKTSPSSPNVARSRMERDR